MTLFEADPSDANHLGVVLSTKKRKEEEMTDVVSQFPFYLIFSLVLDISAGSCSVTISEFQVLNSRGVVSLTEVFIYFAP